MFDYDNMGRFTHNGRDYVATIEPDYDREPPWDACDGHGPVSEWTRRDKRPGEWVLASDRGSRRFYDFQEACRIARRDGWNAKPYDVPGETPRQRAAKAALSDFKFLKSWCDNEWHYCGVIVRRAGDCSHCGATTSLWGIESNAHDYLEEVARELAEELAALA